MPETSVTNILGNITFPRQTSLIKRLRKISFFINDTILLASFFVVLVWITDIPSVSTFLFEKLTMAPFTAVLFLLAGTPLLFGAKRHRINTEYIKEEKASWWHTVIPILFAVATAIFGFINFVQPAGALSLLGTSYFEGFCFFIIGLALIPPYTWIQHRFHITQLLIFIVGGINMFIVLEHIYQLFSKQPMQHMLYIPLQTVLPFIVFCLGILLRWTNRGFFGNFTLDATASIFALRLFLINLISAPLIAFIVLYLMQKSSYNMYQILAVVVVGFAFLSCTILWINVKLLYKYELEHLLMKESLKTHNIDLTTEKDTLERRMAQLEQEKQQYVNKLTVQDKWQDAVDRLG